MGVVQDSIGALTVAFLVSKLSESLSKAPETTITPLVSTILNTSPSVYANPTGFLSGLTDLTGVFEPPTVKQLKLVADPFYNPKPLVTTNKGGGQYKKGKYDYGRDYAVGPITTLGQSFKLNLNGSDFSDTFIQDFGSGRF